MGGDLSSPTLDAYAGIDVAFAKGKRLPIVVCISREGRLEPLALREKSAPLPPIGQGNAKTVDREAVADFAAATVDYLRAVERTFGVAIRRVALDCPSDPKGAGEPRRRAERALDCRSIRCITTPSAGEFEIIRRRVTDHLTGGGLVSRLPHANQLWMLVGFDLFRRLRDEWDCLEVFPQATVCVLGANAEHKTRRGAVSAQLNAAARFTRWPSGDVLTSLRSIGFGAAHDRSDAYLAAWVASLEPDQREALGEPPNDAIWIPLLSGRGCES